MGKCASKQQQQQLKANTSGFHQRNHHHDHFQQQIFNEYVEKNKATAGADTTRSSISEQSIFLLIENEGQSESKKRSRSVETKGTAMSFGFKKKLLPAHKKNTVADGTKLNDNNQISQKDDNTFCASDSNGNSEESCENAGRWSTQRLSPPKKEAAGGPYRSTRFGFRVNRPASTGNNNSSCDNVLNNNHSESKMNVKPRSKSACGSRRSINSSASVESHQRQPTVHFKLPSPHKDQHDTPSKKINNPKIVNMAVDSETVNSNNNIESSANCNADFVTSRMNTQQQRKLFFMQANAIQNNFNQNKPPSGKRSYTIINTELHTNEIVRPTPQTTTTIVSKFTLHTSSLPKPQYPVPISLATRNSMDTKNAKQAANNTKKGFQAQREISADSGIGSLSSQSGSDVKKSPQCQRHRPRNLEMVFSGRNKFHVRDLNVDTLISDENVQPLALPRLPTALNAARQQAVSLSGLVRTNLNGDSSTNCIDTNGRQLSMASISSEYIGDEKHQRDNSISEKHSNIAMVAPTYSSLARNIVRSHTTLGTHFGDVMATKDGISMSSNDSSGRSNNRNQNVNNNEIDDDISTITLTTDNKFSSMSSNTTIPQSDTRCSYASESNANNLVQDTKFAAMTAALSDILLDDETSPSDSLISSTASDDIGSKKTKKMINDSIKESGEKDINDISPIFEVASPISHGTPTHATNSFSFSDGDGGRDFLIDDEIADQPFLCFGDDHASNTQLHSIVDTLTLKDNSSAKSSLKRKSVSNNNSMNNSYAPQPKPRQSIISRTESLDTLSPCESICSEDLMMDFECNSSIDSIDRISCSNHSGSAEFNGTSNKNNKLDEAQLWTEFEQNGGGHFKDWSFLLKTSRNKCQDISISQLPPRSTRLLNRSRLQQGNLNANGTEGLRSIENLNLINCKTALRLSPQSGRDSANGSPDDQLFMLDKTLRNSLIQDVEYCKQQMLQLRTILQDNEEYLMTRTTSLNSFENNNGKFLDTSGGYDELMNNLEPKERNNYSPSLSDDPKHDLVDLRRQVVYLQSQLDDKDRTIKIQQNLISKLEAEVNQSNFGKNLAQAESSIETVCSATQTDRVRPLSVNFDGTNSNCDDEMIYVIPATISASSSSSSLSSFTSPKKFKLKTIHVKRPDIVNKSEQSCEDNDGIPNTVIGKKILFENNLQKANERQLRYTTTYSRNQLNHNNISNKDDDGPASLTRGKYFRSIVGNAMNQTTNTITTSDSELTLQINRTSPIKSIKLLNNLNVLKSNGFSLSSTRTNDDS